MCCSSSPDVVGTHLANLIRHRDERARSERRSYEKAVLKVQTLVDLFELYGDYRAAPRRRIQSAPVIREAAPTIVEAPRPPPRVQALSPAQQARMTIVDLEIDWDGDATAECAVVSLHGPRVWQSDD